MTSRILCALFLSFGLAGCQTSGAPVRVVDSVQRPNLAPLERAPRPRMERVDWDVPRDAQGRPLRNSNIYIGTSERGFGALQRNILALQLQNQQNEARIDAANRSRAGLDP